MPEPSPALVTTPDECVAFVNAVGLCSWRRSAKLPLGFPSLEAVTPWDGNTGAVFDAMWFWKDDLPIEKRLFYGPLLGDGIPTFVSLAFLPVLIAAQGDNDARTLYEKGQLASNALRVYEHIERSGPTATNQLPWPPGSRHLYLRTLQQRFLLTKHALSGRTRGTYGYVWGLCDTFFPDAFRAAAQIRVADAREQIIAHLHAQEVGIDALRAAKLFRWSPLE